MKLLAMMLLGFCLPILLWAQSGFRGGKLQSLRPATGSSQLSGRSVELVDESEPEAKRHAFRIYVVGPNGDSLDLKEVESWSVEWRTSSKSGRLQDDLKSEKAAAEKEGGPVYSFLATGDLPDDPDVIVEVTLSFHGSRGAGVANFSGLID
ncbi:MAG TPA: hypothetical protein VJR29_00810 [bacterium]|nr:hypothetical protein [bacterium]